ncbi:hypothetical protein Goshw_029622, partial [Gossypium schwendimanii]|nr:hypothetical protein [Gossypium schwendimanii]
MHSPYSTGPPPNRCLVARNAIAARFGYGLLPPLAVIAIPLVKRRLGIPPLFPIFYSILCPHLPSVPSILRRFPSRGNFPFPS